MHSLHVYIIFPGDSGYLVGLGFPHTVPQSLLGVRGWAAGHGARLEHSSASEGWQNPLAARARR